MTRLDYSTVRRAEITILFACFTRSRQSFRTEQVLTSMCPSIERDSLLVRCFGRCFSWTPRKSQKHQYVFHPEMSKYRLKLRNNKLVLFTKFLSSFSDQQFFLRAQFFWLKGQTKLCQMPWVLPALLYI